MPVIKRLIYTYLLLLFISGCIYDYNPKIEKYENLLVVYGLLTDLQGPHVVKLSRSSDINSSVPQWETGAIITLIQEEQNPLVMEETSEGVYSTSNDFVGVIGEKYKIHISTNNGNEYESEYITLQDIPEIGSVYAEYEERPTTNINVDLKGYQFYVDTDASDSDVEYFRWDMIETWEFHMPYYVDKLWTGDTIIDSILPSVCYREQKVNEFFISSSNEYSSNVIKRFPLNYVSNETDKLRVKYSLFVNQYALSKESYFYWKNQLTNNQQQGGLYDSQPFQIIGNIRCLTDPDEVVLGIFEASHVASKRVIVEKPPNLSFSRLDIGCEIIAVGDPPIPEKIVEGFGVGEYYLWSDGLTYYAISNSFCSDCRSRAGFIQQPSYWDN